ncbi:MAG: hypothetical protein RBQ84_04865 [Arcobacter sp.]|jgi:phage anti-repressor protein|nr:hypothetical protein [Arcobacter sp.]
MEKKYLKLIFTLHFLLIPSIYAKEIKSILKIKPEVKYDENLKYKEINKYKEKKNNDIKSNYDFGINIDINKELMLARNFKGN